MISLLRVDGRLVHGMVAVTWVGELKPNVLVVANDAAANDSFHTMTLKLAKPANVDMYVWTLAKAVDRLNGPKYKAKKIFITVGTIADAEALVSQCPEIRRVNVGPEVDGTKGRVTEGKVEISDGVFASPEEFACLKRIHDQGVKVCFECAVMALDADVIEWGKPVVALGGTASGADTAIVITPGYSASILTTRIHEILCKPALMPDSGSSGRNSST